MRKLYTILVAAAIGIGLFAVPASVAAQDAPQQIQPALDDLSSRTGTAVNLGDLASYTYEIRQFNDTSLGCPQPGQTYAQVLTSGYQFDLIYQGQRYDYRVSEDSTTVILCSVEQVTGPGTPANPAVRQMELPIVAVTPLIGEAGSSVQIIANGFPPSQQAVIGVGTPNSEYDVVRTVRTTNQGAVNATITIPGYFDGESEVVVVVETSDNSLRVVSYPFTLAGTPGDGTTVNPQVSLSTLTGPPGSAVQLTATGFPPNASVLIGVGPQNAADFVYSLRETTDAQGSMSVEIAIPETAQANQPYIALVELEADRNVEATSPVFLTTGIPPTPVPEGTEFTSASIYLIAPGDAGQSGVEVGCQDSAVPVQVTFAPTVAPLTSALEQLLNLNTRMYGQSGLYNALYQSNLTVEGINIQNGVATIALSGTLVSGGTCDDPRIEAQIRQTALQFSTINDTEILVNGQRIADVLTAQ